MCGLSACASVVTNLSVLSLEKSVRLGGNGLKVGGHQVIHPGRSKGPDCRTSTGEVSLARGSHGFVQTPADWKQHEPDNVGYYMELLHHEPAEVHLTLESYFEIDYDNHVQISTNTLTEALELQAGLQPAMLA